LQAKEEAPDREVVVIESTRVAQGASGRNGGFADPSLTHGLSNGQWHFPREWEEIERFGRENYEGFVAAIERYAIDAALEQNGEILVATEPYQVKELQEAHEELESLTEDSEYFDRDAIQAEVMSSIPPSSPGDCATRSYGWAFDSTRTLRWRGSLESVAPWKSAVLPAV